MTGTSKPESPMNEGKDGQSPSSERGRLAPSVLGLSIVSGLNVICLAFMVYHFASHPSDPAAEAAEPSAGMSLAEADNLGAANSIFGNVDFAPMSELIVSVASGTPKSPQEPAHQQENGSMTPATISRMAAAPYPTTDRRSGSWVQLGALSHAATAVQYWTVLKERHATLLQNSEPHYVGPDDVGGSLYHIRIGPMANDAATGLCNKLEAEGADCFCVRPMQMEAS